RHDQPADDSLGDDGYRIARLGYEPGHRLDQVDVGHDESEADGGAEHLGEGSHVSNLIETGDRGQSRKGRGPVAEFAVVVVFNDQRTILPTPTDERMTPGGAQPGTQWILVGRCDMDESDGPLLR